MAMDGHIGVVAKKRHKTEILNNEQTLHGNEWAYRSRRKKNTMRQKF